MLTHATTVVSSNVKPLVPPTTLQPAGVISVAEKSYSPPMELQSKMLLSAVGETDGLEARVGETILRDCGLLMQAGELLARKMLASPGTIFNSIQIIVEIGEHSYRGLGLSIALHLAKNPNVNLKGLKIMTIRWEDVASLKADADFKNPSIVFVTSARTPEIEDRLQEAMDLFRKQIYTGSNIIGSCSLVSMHGENHSETQGVRQPRGLVRTSGPVNVVGVQIS